MKLEDMKNDELAILKYGSEYHIWKDDKYLGVATWTKDENFGDCFKTSFIDETGRFLSQVYDADKWLLCIRRGIVASFYEYF